MRGDTIAHPSPGRFGNIHILQRQSRESADPVFEHDVVQIDKLAAAQNQTIRALGMIELRKQPAAIIKKLGIRLRFFHQDDQAWRHPGGMRSHQIPHHIHLSWGCRGE